MLILKELETKKQGNSSGLLNERYKLLEQIGEGTEAYVNKCEDIKEENKQFQLWVDFICFISKKKTTRIKHLKKLN